MDFGLGKRFTSKNFRKSSIKKMKYFIGSLYFTSTSALVGIEQTPKDEIESLFLCTNIFEERYSSLNKE